MATYKTAEVAKSEKSLKRFQVTPVSPFLLLIVELTIDVVYCFVSMLSLLIVAEGKNQWFMDSICRKLVTCNDLNA